VADVRATLPAVALSLSVVALPLFASTRQGIAHSYADVTMTFAPHFEPMPASCEVESNVVVALTRGLPFSIACRDAEDDAVVWANDHLVMWFGGRRGWFERLFSSPNVPKASRATYVGEPTGPEGYELECSPEGVSIRAETLQGVRYALYTMRHATMAARGGMAVDHYIMPALRISDSPKLAFRGIHIPWGIGQSVTEIEKRVRLAAVLKYNYAVIEPWGTFRSERYPWWGWKEGSMTPDAVRRIVKVGKELGITLCPQIPAFGHASMGITSPGRHAVLDAHPECQPLFESLNGWNWCLSNPKTMQVLTGLADELVELFDNPPFFHVGCDEAAPPNCPLCVASDYRRLVVRHIHALHDMLEKRGARMMLWHDMFLKSGDPRWEGFYANGTEETANALADLPRDIVICDWFYGPKAMPDYPSLRMFKKLGFTVLTCPWYELEGTAAQCRFAASNDIDGMLSTTWSDGEGKAKGRYFANCFAGAACYAWALEYAESDRWKWKYDIDMIKTLREVVWDMGLENYVDTGTYVDKSFD